MEKRYNHQEVEKRIYKMWEESGKFAPSDTGEPFTIVLPPPNASGGMHVGNVLMVAVEDLLIRWKRLQGYAALWLPGTDHAGFETQTTYERELEKQGKSRLDFDRDTLYNDIMDFVMKNKSFIENQLRSMGASVDWSRYRFTLDDESLRVVLSTFEKMEKEGLVYRDNYVVNYSFKWGTTFSDAEIVSEEKQRPFYYVKYPLVKSPKSDEDYAVIATTRPETIATDTHVAVNPKDKRWKHLIGKKIFNPIRGHEMEVIGDSWVDMEMGTGMVKLTPAHDKNDYKLALAHNLPVVGIIGIDGKMNKNSGEYEGMTIKAARAKSIEQLEELGMMHHIDSEYKSMVPVDYRSGDYIENLVLPNWFIKVESLKKPAYDVVKSNKVKIFPKWRKVTYLRWVENMYDWAISRQVVWGIRIPVWYKVSDASEIHVTFLDKNKKPQMGLIKDLLANHTLAEIEKGLQTLVAPRDIEYVVSKDKPSGDYLPGTDTFDTWFSSGQWPLVTTRYPDSDDFKRFYPTSVLETGWEIVTRWVSRMIMFGIYLTGEPPFKDIYLHGHVRAVDGRKMSKSLGNNIDPEKYLQEYGADALRMGLIAGTANGKDFNFPQDKVVAYRNFANKIWNMARFMNMLVEQSGLPQKSVTSSEDKAVIAGLNTLIENVNESLEKYRFADAAEFIYQFMWHEVADVYIEYVKDHKESLGTLHFVFSECLKLLHPFMPFVTEELWQNIGNDGLLMVSGWPEAE